MRVLLDTNVLLDIALGRQPFAQSSLAAFEKVRASGEMPLVAPHSLAIFYYIVGKAYSQKRAQLAVEDLLTTAEVGRFDHETALRSCELEMADFEDAMIVATAIENKVDCILTRNESDFSASPVAVKGPETFDV